MLYSFESDKIDCDDPLPGLIHQRLRHFLRSYRKRHTLTLAQMAQKMGYTLDHYRKFEGPAAQNRFTHAIHFISSFGQLEGMSVHEFLEYLIPCQSMAKLQLHPWQRTLLDALAKTDSKTRSDLCHDICARVNNGQIDLKKFATMLAFIPKLAALEEAQLEALTTILDGLSMQKKEHR